MDETCAYLTDPAGQQHLLHQPETVLGRSVDCDIVVVNKRVSREHACIRRDGRKINLQDLNSTNGTYLNDERITESVPLRDGDRLLIGDIIFVFHDPDTTTRENPIPELDVNLAAAVVRINRIAVALSPKEFSLLAYLFENRGKVCSKDEIGAAVWSEYQSDSGIYDYQIENLVRRLRTKIETDPTNPQLLLTIRGLGYKLT